MTTYTDMITGQQVEPWALHFLERREKNAELRSHLARALSIPQHHTSWDTLSEVEKDLFYMQADYAIAALKSASGTEAGTAETTKIGSVDEGPTAESGDAQPPGRNPE